MKLWLDVQLNGATIGPGPVVALAAFSSRARLNQAGDWRATVPATDERVVDLLQPRRTVLAYISLNGQPVFVGGGTIENLRVSIADGAPMLEISGRDLLEELNRGTVGDVVLQPGSAFYYGQFITANMPAGWSTGPVIGTPPPFVAHFSHDTFLGSLTALAERLPWWFHQAGVRQLQFYAGALPSTVMLRASTNADPVAAERNDQLCLIRSISEERQAADVTTRLIAFGAGNAQARLTMAAATLWPNGTAIGSPYTTPDGDSFVFDRASNTITNAAAEVLYGRIERAGAWKEIAPISNSNADVQAAANTLVVAACEYLRRCRAPSYLYALDVAGVRRSVRPGDLVHVSARRFRDGERPINIDRPLRVLEVATSIDDAGIRTDGLTVSTLDYWPAGDNEAIVSEIRQSRVMEALPQMGPSVDTVSYRESIDDDYSADFRFWMGNETTSVNQVLVRFRADPFRSTAKTIGGAVSATVDLPDHSHDIPDHQHRLKIIGNGAGALTYNIGFGAGSTSGGVRHNINSSDWDWVTDADSGETTSEDGGGQTGLEVDISSALSLSYGIYEDEPGNTYAATDLEWLVNGALIAAVPVGTSGGWFELDVTAYVADGNTFRPLQPDNTISVRVQSARRTGKRCQVTAQIERRTVIQAIAYS